MHFVFPSNFVYWAEVENHKKIKQKYYQTILKISEDWENNPHFYTKFKSSFRNYQDTIVNQQIKNDNLFLDNVVWNPIDQMFSQDFFNCMLPDSSEISELWFNVYKPGQSQEVHDHNGFFTSVDGKPVSSSYSGIYILHSEESNKTVFYQQGPSPGAPVSGAINYRTDHITEGNVIIFPSNLLHYVLPCERPRTTIAFNIISTYSADLDRGLI